MTTKRIFGAVVGLGGFIIVGLTGNWLLALGVLVMIWGNNMERSS